MSKPLSHKETHDNYHGVILRRGRFRIVLCRNGVQWIIQKGKQSGPHMRWRGQSYCRTKKALVRLWTQLSTSSALALDLLPDICGGGGK